VILSSIENDQVLFPRGATTGIRIEPGFENWMSTVRGDGVAETGIPAALKFNTHLVRWARLFRGTKKDFEKQVRHFQKTWSEAVLETARFHHELASRKLAAQEERQKQQAKKQAEVEARNRYLRGLFRQKNFLD
jgi:hypothetical protein